MLTWAIESSVTRSTLSKKCGMESARFARDKQMLLHKCRSRPRQSPVDEPASPSAASLLPPLDHDKMIAELRLHERGQDGLVDRGRLQRERGVLEGSLRLPVIK